MDINTDVVVFDIETKTNRRMIRFIEPAVAPKNYKDPQKIADYIHKKNQEAVETMALDIDYARVIAIGYAIGLEEKPTVLVANTLKAERAMLETIWEIFNLHPKLIGFNILGFDLPILLRRSWVLRVRPVYIPDMSRYSKDVVDLMQRLYHNGYGLGPKARGLKAVCKMYRIPNPLPNVDGSQVSNMTKKQLIRYTTNDVRMTQLLAQKTQGWYW